MNRRRGKSRLPIPKAAHFFDHTLVLDLHQRHHSSINTEAAAASALKTMTFKKGQIWRIGDLNLAVVSVGKTLVHHRNYTTQPKGVHTTMTSKSDLRKYLLNGNAVLVAEIVDKRAHRRRQPSRAESSRSSARAS